MLCAPRFHRVFGVVFGLALSVGCGSGEGAAEGARGLEAAPAPTPLAAAADGSSKMVGYDLRRLRPRDDETLAAMFERLRVQASADKKRVAVLFSADWCAPCKRIEAELGSLQPAEQIGDVRIFELKEEDWVEVTRMSEFNDLRARWYPKKGSYPVLVLLRDDGTVLEEMKEAIDRLEGENVEATLPNWFATSRR
ncbi:MAG TPA: thioredoxin family protein [Nannocystis exedens]|nr:thioredoxin family protein [Nannocystis exedens]